MAVATPICAAAVFLFGRQRTVLLPVLPGKLGLLPAVLVTKIFNDDNDLREFQGVVTGVTCKMKREPEADPLATRVRPSLPRRPNGRPMALGVVKGTPWVKGHGSNSATRSG